MFLVSSTLLSLSIFYPSLLSIQGPTASGREAANSTALCKKMLGSSRPPGWISTLSQNYSFICARDIITQPKKKSFIFLTYTLLFFFQHLILRKFKVIQYLCFLPTHTRTWEWFNTSSTSTSFLLLSRILKIHSF